MYQTMQHHSAEDNFHCHSCENVCKHIETKQMNGKLWRSHIQDPGSRLDLGLILL